MLIRTEQSVLFVNIKYMAVDNGLRKGENYPATQEDFNNDITTLCVLCQDIVNGIVIDKGSEDICITDIVNAFEKLKVVDPSLISRLDAKLVKVIVKSETEINIPGVEYDIIIHNEKDQQKITFSICC